MSKSLLDRVQITTPCATNWEAMQGDDRVRHCSQCDKHVYNLSQMTRQQAEALLIKTNGKLCARFERNADGGILTTDQSSSLPRFNFRFLRIASATISAALSLGPTVAAKTPKNLPVFQQQDKQEKPAEQAQQKAKTAKIFGTVFDRAQAVIAAAKITITNTATNDSRTLTSAADGKYEFLGLPAGTYSLVFEAFGFLRHVYTDIQIQEGADLRFDVTLEVAALMGDVVILTPDLPVVEPAENLQLSFHDPIALPEKKIKKNFADVLLFPFKKLKGKKS